MEEIKRLVLNQETEEDQVVSLSLRPGRLVDFIGQPELVKGLKVAMTASQKRGEPLEHTLFSGPPGLGKTSLAHIIANEMNTRITVTSGPAIDRAGDFIGILTNLEKGDVLFIDAVGRTDFPGGSSEALFTSLQRLKRLPPATMVWPGHNYGALPHAALGALCQSNPFLVCESMAEFREYLG